MDITANVPVRIAAALLAAAALLTAACGDDEEQVPDETLPSETTSRTAATSDATPSPAAATPAATVTPAPVPSDWKTYTDSDLSFSLRYPPDLVFKDLTAPGDTTQRYLQFRSDSDASRSFTIAIVADTEDLPLEDWVEEFTACLPDTLKSGTVSGSQSISCVSMPEEIAESAVAFEHSGWVVFMTSIMSESELARVVETISL